jgi:hypothetical protein
MQDETSRAGMPGPIDARRPVLGLLLVEQDQRPWLHAEIELEIGDRIATATAIDQLYAEGLVHRLGEFVFATRAAVNMERIVAVRSRRRCEQRWLSGRVRGHEYRWPRPPQPTADRRFPPRSPSATSHAASSPT